MDLSVIKLQDWKALSTQIALGLRTLCRQLRITNDFPARLPLTVC